MWLFLLTNWRYILTSGLTFVLAYFFHSLDVSYLEIKHAKQMQTQKEELVGQCKKAQKLTEDSANDLLKKTSDLTAKLNAYKLRLKSQPVPATNTASGNDGSPRSCQYAGSDSVDLLDYAADAEKYRLQLISCQNFITKVWATQP